MANRYRNTPEGWREAGCGCSGSKPTGPALAGVNNNQLLVWLVPMPAVVVAPDGSTYQTQASQVILDLTDAAYVVFLTDARFRLPSEAEKLSLFGYKARTK